MQPNDEEIVLRVLEGDLEAYGTLVERNRDRCVRYAYRILGDMDEAEDVAQEAFVRAYKSLPQCDDPARFGAWLFQILVNRCRTTYAKHSDREQRFVALSHADVVVDPTTANTDIASDGNAKLEQAERALAKLPVVLREAFLLKHVEEMSYSEMGKATGVGTSALKMRVSRATSALRLILDAQTARNEHAS